MISTSTSRTFCLFLTLFFLPFGLLHTSLKEPTPAIICIDAGHGGFDAGTSSGDILEKDINLKASFYLGEYLSHVGYSISYTRTTDKAIATTKQEDMETRLKKINRSDVLLYISIHTNSYPSENVSGAQAFYSTNNPKNKEIANQIQKMLEIFDTSNKRTAKTIQDKYIPDNATTQGILLELGFLTSSKDLDYLLSDEKLKLLMTYVGVGILEYLSNVT